MNLHNIGDNTGRIFLVTTGLLIGALPAQASVTYKFTSAPITVGTALESGTVVQTTPAPRLGYMNIGSPQTASLTFSSPLAPNSVIQIAQESGGFDFLPGRSQGGVEAYSALGFPQPITSDINEYTHFLGGASGNPLITDGYSSLDGQVTTDASGKIANWNLSFISYIAPGGRFIIDPAANTIDSTPGLDRAFLLISSNPASDQKIDNVSMLNGQVQDPHIQFAFKGADTMYIEGLAGDPAYKYYTALPGNMVLVPEPEGWAMMMAGLALLGWKKRRLINKEENE